MTGYDKMPKYVVSKVPLKAGTGKHVRMVTEVIRTTDGKTIVFTELLSKAEAIRQAEYQWSK